MGGTFQHWPWYRPGPHVGCECPNFRFSGLGQCTDSSQILYYQYVVKQGRKAKWITQAKEKMDSLGGEGNRK